MNKARLGALKRDYRLVNLAVIVLIGALLVKAMDEYERMDKLEKYFATHPDEAKHLLAVLQGKES